MINAAFLLSADALADVYPPRVLARVRSMAHIGPIVTPASAWRGHRQALASVEAVFSGWGAPVMDEELLQAMPALKVVFYAGGTVRYFVTEEMWARGITLVNASAINAVPVCEYTTSVILLGLKRFWFFAQQVRGRETFPLERPMPGAYRSSVGLVSYGVIARMVREKLRAHQLDVLVYDPFLEEEEARAEQVTKVDLPVLFARCDVVSVHTPLLPETMGLITGDHLGSMRDGALLVNTARGEIIDEPAMIAVLSRRPDLQAILDVTAPEPPVPGSPLYRLPNVILTPHIAGSLGPECERMGHAMVDELDRYLKGAALRWEVTPARAVNIA